jgi:hypothetical protein
VIWVHRKRHTRYTELEDGDPAIRARFRWDILAKSELTGRWVWVRRDALLALETEAEVQEAEAYVRREHLSHLAWQLSRELPYNLGTAITNIALSDHGGSLDVAIGALRDEIERTRHNAGTTPDQGA